MSGMLSAEQLAILRSAPHAVRRYLSVVPPAVVYTARINQAGFTYPLAQLTYDGGSGVLADVLPGMTLWVGTTVGAHDVFVGRVRKAPTSSVLYINETSRGDAGYPTERQVEFADNQYITVLATYDLWYAFPRIVETAPDNWVFYKDFDLAFTPGADGQGAKPPPVANIGSFRPGFAGPNGTRVLDFTSAASLPIAPGASLASRLWDFDDGTPGSSGEIAPTGISFPNTKEFRWITCAVTDTNGKTHTARAGVWVHTDANAPLRVVGVEGDTRDRTGRRMSVALHPGDADRATLPLGALVCYWEAVTYGGQVLAETASVFTGWVVRHRARITSGGEEVVIDIEGPGTLLQRTAAVTQRIEQSDNPQNWTQVLPALCHHDRVVWYLLHWHCPALLELFDLHLTGVTYRRNAFSLPQTRLGAQLQDVCARVMANFGSDSSGALWMRQNPMYFDDAARAARATRMTLDVDDWLEIEEIAGEHRRAAHSVLATGFSYNGTQTVPHLARAPGKASGQGADEAQLEGVTVQGQLELNRWAGHEYALQNNPYPNITVKIRPYDVFEPAHMEWVGLIVPAGRDPLGLGFAGKRCLLHAVSVTHDIPGGFKDITLRMEGEVFGTPGVALPVPQEGAPTETPPEIIFPPEPIGGSAFPNHVLPTRLVALMANGHVARATSYQPGVEVIWGDATGAMTGSCSAGGYLYADLWRPQRYWVSNADGLWKTEDLWAASPTWTLVSSDSRLKNARKLIQSIRQEGWMAAQTSGYAVCYSTDNFATTINDVPMTGYLGYIGMTVAQGGRSSGSGVQLYLLGRVSAAPGWALYVVYSDDGGASTVQRGTPGVSTNSPLSNGWNPGIEVPVFDDDGDWNVDGDLLYVSGQTYPVGADENVWRSEDGGATFTEFYAGRLWYGRHWTAGAMQDNSVLAWILRDINTNNTALMFSSDGGDSWDEWTDGGGDSIRYSDNWAGVNGYPYHNGWFIWWRNYYGGIYNAGVFATDDLGETYADISGSGATRIFTVTGQSETSAPVIINAQADLSDYGWVWE